MRQTTEVQQEGSNVEESQSKQGYQNCRCYDYTGPHYYDDGPKAAPTRVRCLSNSRLQGKTTKVFVWTKECPCCSHYEPEELVMPMRHRKIKNA